MDEEGLTPLHYASRFKRESKKKIEHEEEEHEVISYNIINSLPNDKTLDITKLKAFADDKLNVAKMTISL